MKKIKVQIIKDGTRLLVPGHKSEFYIQKGPSESIEYTLKTLGIARQVLSIEFSGEGKAVVSYEPAHKFDTRGEAEEKGFATYNNAPHTCIEIDPDSKHTISLKIGAQRVTIAVCPLVSQMGKPLGQAECLDIKLHDQDRQKNIIFKEDGGRVTEDGLMTLLLNPEHYRDKKAVCALAEQKGFNVERTPDGWSVGTMEELSDGVSFEWEAEGMTTEEALKFLEQSPQNLSA